VIDSFADVVSKTSNIKNGSTSLNLPRKHATVLIGKNRPANLANEKVSAAKPSVGKSIFCIDNVSVKASVSDIVCYVNKLGVPDVISCFEVQPRRSQWQRANDIVPIDRKAFRLCIPREDCDMLLNENAWPAHVSISAWRFKKKSSDPSSDYDNGYGQRLNIGCHDRARQSSPVAAATMERAAPSAGETSTPALVKSGGSQMSSSLSSSTPPTELTTPIVLNSPFFSGEDAEPILSMGDNNIDDTSDMDLTIIDYDGSKSNCN
jgi:hypothetical protein